MVGYTYVTEEVEEIVLLECLRIDITLPVNCNNQISIVMAIQYGDKTLNHSCGVKIACFKKINRSFVGGYIH